MANERVLDIVVRLTGADKATTAVKNLQERGTTAARQFIGDWKQAALTLGIYTTAIVAAKRVVDSFVSASIQQQQAETRLRAALIATGQASQQTFDSVKSYASELQRTANIGDELAISMGAQIQALGKLSGEEIPKAMQATVGLAKLTGMDLNGAALLVAKTLNSSTNALSRYGIQLDTSKTKSEKLDEITRATAAGFKIAQAEADTYEGKLIGLQNAQGDLNEAVGDLITHSPDAKAAFDEMKSGIEGFTEALELSLPKINSFFTDVQVGLATMAFIGTPLDFLRGTDARSKLRKQFPRMSDAEINRLLSEQVAAQANEIIVTRSESALGGTNPKKPTTSNGNGGGTAKIIPLDNVSRFGGLVSPNEKLQFMESYKPIAGNRFRQARREDFMAQAAGDAALAQRLAESFNMRQEQQFQIDQRIIPGERFSNAQIENMEDASERARARRENRRSDITGAAVSIAEGAANGGVRGAAQSAISTGLGMVAANNPAFAIPIAIAQAFLPGLFQQHQRQPITEPIPTNIMNTEDIVGPLNSTLNHLLRAVVSGGVDRLAADAARQQLAA